MSREYVPRVFDADVALYHRFGEVAKCTEDNHYKGHAYPLPCVHEGEELGHGKGTGYGEQCAADRAFPRLLGRDAWKQPMASYGDSCEVGTRVVDPDEYVHGERYGIVGCRTAEAVKLRECKHIDERQGQHDVQLAQHDGSQVGNGIGILAIQLLDIAVQEEQQVGSE